MMKHVIGRKEGGGHILWVEQVIKNVSRDPGFRQKRNDKHFWGACD